MGKYSKSQMWNTFVPVNCETYYTIHCQVNRDNCMPIYIEMFQIEFFDRMKWKRTWLEWSCATGLIEWKKEKENKKMMAKNIKI